MGGSLTFGNVTPAAEFNIWCDPEAAHVVFTSGIPIKMVGLNVTRQVVATPERRAQIRALGSRTGTHRRRHARLLQRAATRARGLPGGSMHDPLAVAALVDPEVLRFEPMHVAIELRGTHTYGMTLCDARHLRKRSDTEAGHPESRPPRRSAERRGGGRGQRRPLLGDVPRCAGDVSMTSREVGKIAKQSLGRRLRRPSSPARGSREEQRGTGREEHCCPGESLPELIRSEFETLDMRVRRLLNHNECLSVKRIVITGCGDSHMAGLAAELAFEQIAGIPTEPMTAMQAARYGTRPLREAFPA